jgi:type II secretory pathway component GspD/PulD (secretin)
MKMMRILAVGLWGLVIAGSGIGTAVMGQTTATRRAPVASTAPATATSGPATRVRKPSVGELLSPKKVHFEFAVASPGEVLEFIGKEFHAKVENAFEKELTDRVSISGDFGATEAISSLNAGLRPKGYAINTSVRVEEATPQLVFTIMQIRNDAGNQAQVFVGMDPSQIPEGNELRTQVMTVKNVDLVKYADMLTDVMSDGAAIDINPDTKTVTATDTSTHIRVLAAMLQRLEKQAAAGGK